MLYVFLHVERDQCFQVAGDVQGIFYPHLLINESEALQVIKIPSRPQVIRFYHRTQR